MPELPEVETLSRQPAKENLRMRNTNLKGLRR